MTLTRVPSKNNILDNRNTTVNSPFLIIDLEDQAKVSRGRQLGYDTTKLDKELKELVKTKLAKRLYWSICKSFGYSVYRVPMSVVKDRPWIYGYVVDVADVYDGAEKEVKEEEEVGGTTWDEVF